MRKITKLARKAFLNAEPFKLDNTEVKVYTGEFGSIITEMSLFGNIIARRYSNVSSSDSFQIIAITNAGYKTATTKERLNHIIPQVSIRQRDGDWWIEQGMAWKLWDGDWKVVFAEVLI